MSQVAEAAHSHAAIDVARLEHAESPVEQEYFWLMQVTY